jgi:hypothetical protein
MHTFWSRTMIWLFIVMLLSVPLSAATEAAPPVQATALTTAAVPRTSPILLRQAAFQAYNSDPQAAWGDVQHRRVSGGEVLRLAPSFKAAPGPTLNVLLTASAVPTLQEIAAAPTLAKLDSLAGPQEFPVPADQAFGAVVIYNSQEGTVAAIAPLAPEPACENGGSLGTDDVRQIADSCLRIKAISEMNRTGMQPDKLDIDAYRLAVTGQVEKPLSLSYADLKQLQATSEVQALICPGFFIDIVEWTGVPLSALMQAAQAKPDFKSVRFESVDGYYSTVRREDLQPEHVIAAYLVNGEELPMLHGYPVRMAIPHTYGSNWVKWLGKIEFLDK